MKDKIITFFFIGYIAFFSITHILIEDNEISVSERRKLSSFPDFELTREYITKMDKYLVEQFPFRDAFRSLKAHFNYNVLGKYDNNGIYIKDNYIYKSNYPTNEKSIHKFINNIEYFKNILPNENMYLMIIPDKNYYLDDYNFLKIDYDYIYEQIHSLDLNIIDIRNTLSINDYYETDTHWRQEHLHKVIKQMSDIMHFTYVDEIYDIDSYDKFYGVYYGESALSRKPETLYYLTNDFIMNARVNYLENNNLHSIYNYDKLNGLDAYEVYLDGASSLIEIYNDMVHSDKELIVFRDSFGSSLVPLLANYYSKITVIDNRYINSNEILKRVDFNNQDILFTYSTLLVNDSGSLKA